MKFTRKTCVAGLTLTLLGVSTFMVSFRNQTAEFPEGLSVPEGFTIERAIDPELISYPMFASYDDNGRLFLFEATASNDITTDEMVKDPKYHVRVVEDTDGDGIFDKSQIYADKIRLPMGGSFYQGSLYVAESPELVRYTDTDGDGKADKREVILDGWVLNANAATLSGPFFGPDGWMYLPDARRSFDITTKEGVNLKGKGARIWRCRPDGSGLESMSGGGFDNAIEIAFMPAGETIGTMTYFTDPQGGFRDALMHWVEGGVYPKHNPVIEEDKLPLTGPLMPTLSKTARVAPSGLMRYQGKAFGDEYQNNLFSAEFNTGRIMRHIFSPDIATYQSVNEPFMKSTSSDSHPTDVLQDADGSMLVVVTGGWFINGCPLSRVAKPNVLGGIYRIRKNGAPQVNDPWGKKINFAQASIKQLAAYTKDSRTAVRQKAFDTLVQKGNTAIPELQKIINQSKDEDTKASAVFAIARINTSQSALALRNLMSNPNAVTATAAIRSVGLAKDPQALGKLMEIVQKGNPQVRRQAATALGQIGDAKAIPALLKAANNPDDRFVEHAIIYSLIQFNQPEPLLASLKTGSVNIKKAAVIALDQMHTPLFKKEHLAPFLESNDEDLQNTGIWVATHHPEWTDIVVAFLEKRLLKSNNNEEDIASLKSLMLTFCGNDALQEYITRQLAGNIDTERKLLLFSVMGECQITNLPTAWVNEIGKLLKSDDQKIRSAALNIIESRRIASLENDLNQLIQQNSTSPSVRIQALSAKLITKPQLSKEDFALVNQYLKSGNESPVRQSAARLLVQAQPTDEQLILLANSQIAQAEPFLVPTLTAAFADSKSEAVGMALVKSLGASASHLDILSEPDLKRLIEKYPVSVQEAAKPLVEQLRNRQAERLARLESIEKQLPRGDVSEGRKLFFGKATCSACHAVQSQGSDFGPDLTNIGDIRSRHDMLEAIIYPSVSFAREYETFKVVTKDNTFTGVIKEQTPDYVTIAVGPGPAGLRVPRAEIISIEAHDVSMMPPGLDQLLNIQEMADLVSFMESLPDGLKLVKTR